MARTRLTSEEFLRRANIAHANKYDYSLTILASQRDSVDVICPLHGKFQIAPSNHIRNYDNSNPNTSYRPVGCGECGREHTIQRNQRGLDSKEQFVAKANIVHNDQYSYPGEYIGQNNKIDISCPTHGIFRQSGVNHLRGSGCPKCKNSRGATLIAKCLTRLKVQYIQEHSFPDCKGESNLLRFDFWLPVSNVLIEYDGEQHFRPVRFGNMSVEAADQKFQQGQQYDSIKTEYAETLGIKLIRISYYDKGNIRELLERELSNPPTT